MASYIPSTRAEREEMLAVVGVNSYEDLYRMCPPRCFCMTAI